MNDMIAWGLDAVRWVQGGATDALTALVAGFTLMGSAQFALAAILAAYWCVEARGGFRLAVLLLVSGFLNGRLKEVFMVGRPFSYDQSLLATARFPWVPDWVLGLDRFSFPSGHSQTAAVFWAFLASVKRTRPMYALAVAAPLAVAYSRVYLGAHFPTDVGAGLLLGYCLVGVYLVGSDSLTSWGRKLPPRVLLAVAALVALSMNFISMTLAGRVLEVTSESTKVDISMASALFGLVSGYVLMRTKARFDARGSLGVKIARLVVGGGLALSLYAGIGWAIGLAGPDARLLGSFLKYAAVGFWCAFGAPWLFIKIGLASVLADPEGDPAEARGQI